MKNFPRKKSVISKIDGINAINEISTLKKYNAIIWKAIQKDGNNIISMSNIEKNTSKRYRITNKTGQTGIGCILIIGTSKAVTNENINE